MVAKGSVKGNSLFFNNWEEAQREVFVSKGLVGLPGLANRRDTDTGCDCIVVIVLTQVFVWQHIKSLERKNGTQTRKLSKVVKSL